jgi:hypothetical protein
LDPENYWQGEFAEKHPTLSASIHKIPNSKHQIPNKSQIPIINDPNVWDFEFWFRLRRNLFEIWDLLFGILYSAVLVIDNYDELD